MFNILHRMLLKIGIAIASNKDGVCCSFSSDPTVPMVISVGSIVSWSCGDKRPRPDMEWTLQMSAPSTAPAAATHTGDTILQILPECGEVWVGDCGKVFAVGFAEPPRRLALLARN